MDKALKQRLVGASVLIILAVIVLPMLLSGRSDRLKQESREIELPAKPDELSIETRRFPVEVPGKPVPAGGQLSREQTQAVSGDQASSIDADTVPELKVAGDAAQELGPDTAAEGSAGTEPVEPGPDSPARDAASPPAVTSITLSSGRASDVDITENVESSPETPRYLVQVASFSSEKRANALADKLRAANLSVLMDVVDRAAGRLHRVRVGPYAERSEADAVVTSLRADMNELAPRVLDLRPDDSAPVSTPSDPLVRWVVQVGSFSNPASAETLVAQLRLSGMTAFSEKVSSDSGTVYKVRVGPEINRAKAVELSGRIKSEHNIDGFITTQE